MDPDTDADPDPANFKMSIFEGTFTSFFKDKTSQNSRNQCFSYYFCFMNPDSDPGGPKTFESYGSGSEKKIQSVQAAFLFM
jgi:hypothetical protein